ncbi:MAG TPA: hypothetical protein VKH37_01660 [Ferruginibacter sp.]|nr:hypothetical protein [Ferruginibacter sp.]
MKQVSFFLIACCLFLVSCDNYGKKYSPDKSHGVFYKGEGLTETHARKLYDYLLSIGYFTTGKDASVQITKSKDTFNVNFVCNKDKLTPEMEEAFVIIGGSVSTSVFDGNPVSVKLCDKYLKPFKDLGYTPPVRDEEIKDEKIQGQ